MSKPLREGDHQRGRTQRSARTSHTAPTPSSPVVVAAVLKVNQHQVVRGEGLTPSQQQNVPWERKAAGEEAAGVADVSCPQGPARREEGSHPPPAQMEETGPLQSGQDSQAWGSLQSCSAFKHGQTHTFPTFHVLTFLHIIVAKNYRRWGGLQQRPAMWGGRESELRGVEELLFHITLSTPLPKPLWRRGKRGQKKQRFLHTAHELWD